MTLAAERVLADAQIAHDLLEKTEDDDVWRIYFVACLSLLRAVGHVLDKVDGNIDQEYRRHVDVFWRDLKSDRDDNVIFWKFIETYRNQVLKTYEFPSEPMTYGLLVPNSLELPGGTLEQGVFWSDGLIIQEGPFAGDDARDLIHTSIRWWRDRLSEIKRAAESRSTLQGSEDLKR